MSLSKQVTVNGSHNLPDEILEKVIINQDLSRLSISEKIDYLKNLSLSLGLNPLTKPFELMKFDGKEVPYARKDATEQLRKINKVSIRSLETKMIENNIYVVTSFAITPDGREDSSTGVVSIAGLKGNALANAMMKAETKAKRRVTLSICGLGFIDESEFESIPGAKRVNVYDDAPIKENIKFIPKKPIKIIDPMTERDIDQDLMDIAWAQDIDDLQDIYTKAYKHWMNQRNKDNMQRCVEAKDERKKQLEKTEEEINQETNEVQS